MNNARILVVDDDLHIRRLLRATLERAGYDVEAAINGAEALSFAGHAPDAVLLDLGLPDRDGLELIPLLKRKIPAPLLVISARETTEDKVAALDLGADDYVTKPFDSEEVLARLRAALRTRQRGAADKGLVRTAELVIDLDKRRVERGGEEVHLTRKEYGVIAELAKAPGRVITHDTILKAVWPHEVEPHIEYLRIVIRNLRQKLEPDPAMPSVIINELGVGYRLMAEA